MATEMNPPVLKSTSYELWKLETQAWTVVTDLSKKKQEVAVALRIPENDKYNIKEKLFCELKLDDLNSENGMNILFHFLDKLLLEDELMDSMHKFEDFENFERKHGQNIREHVANFDLKFRKLEKLNIKIPSEILALKLLGKANLSKQERMIVLTGVNFADKENMYKETKHSLIKFLGTLTDENDRFGHDVKLEPAWRKSTSSSNKAGHIQRGNIGWMKKKLNPLGSDGGEMGRPWRFERNTGRYAEAGKDQKIKSGSVVYKTGIKKKINPSGRDGEVLKCKSCGSFRHLLDDCCYQRCYR